MRTITRILVIMLLVLCLFQGTDLYVWTGSMLYLVIIFLFIFSAIASFKTNASLKINVPEILIIIYIIYLIANNSFKGTFRDNKQLLDYLISFSLYFPLSYLYKNDKEIPKFIFYGIFAGFSIELIVGFGQLFGVIENSNSEFILGGLFKNPGALAGYMAISFPILLSGVFIYKKLFKSENLLYSVFLCLCCSVCLLILCDSRGAWIAVFLSTAFIVDYKFKIIRFTIDHLKTKVSKWVTGIVLMFSVIFLCFVLYQYKADSAFGRLFIWKTSKTMILDKPISGNGFGFFSENYGKIQSQYFLSNNATEKEIQVADYVTCAYNEFLKMLIESGIIGLFLFLSIMYCAFIKRNNKKNKFIIAAKASLLSFIVLCIVSYPFSLMSNQLIMMICLVVLFAVNDFKTYTITGYRKIIISAGLLCIFTLLFFGYRQLYGMSHFHNGYAKVFSGDINNGINEYKKAYPFLKYNGEFLFYYGSAYYLKQDFSASIKYLQEATTISSDPHAFITLGNSLKELKRYKEAEQSYKTASGITPSELYPKYLLSKLYVEMHETGKAIKMAKLIIKKKEKVVTTAGMQIKKEMNDLIDQNNKPVTKF